MTAAVDPRSTLAGCRALFAQVARRFPMLHAVFGLTLAVLLLEYASLSLMIPLSTASNGGGGSSGAMIAAWTSVAAALRLEPGLMTWIWLFLLLLALRNIIGYAHLCLTTLLAKQVHRELSKSVFGRIVYREPMTEIYRRSVGFYITLAGDDTFRAGTLINSGLQALAALVSVIAGLALLYMFSHTAFALTLTFLLISAFGVVWCARTLLRFDARAVALSREARTSFMEALNSLRSIRSMGSERFVDASYAVQMRAYTRLLFLVEVFKNGIKFFPGIVALAIGIAVLAPWRAAPLSLQAATVFAATTIMIRVFLSLGALMTSGGAFLLDSRAARDLVELVSIDQATHSQAPPTAAPARRPARLERLDIAHVHYGYEGHRQLLHDLSVTLRRGRSYAVVGPSGTGKSTFADIVLGLIEPAQGTISVDGRMATAADLRSRVILVEQQPRIFSSSVRDNLTLGLAASDDELRAVLEVVELSTYVQSLPRGLDTVLDYQGANVSGGQRQRLSLARAILRDPDILILDEATSALDAEVEARVIANLRERMRTGIIVFITHDPQIAAEADEVIDLQATSGTEATTA